MAGIFASCSCSPGLARSADSGNPISSRGMREAYGVLPSFFRAILATPSVTFHWCIYGNKALKNSTTIAGQSCRCERDITYFSLEVPQTRPYTEQECGLRNREFAAITNETVEPVRLNSHDHGGVGDVGAGRGNRARVRRRAFAV
jgi:hypothetical protein